MHTEGEKLKQAIEGCRRSLFTFMAERTGPAHQQRLRAGAPALRRRPQGQQLTQKLCHIDNSSRKRHHLGWSGKAWPVHGGGSLTATHDTVIALYSRTAHDCRLCYFCSSCEANEHAPNSHAQPGQRLEDKKSKLQ